MSNVKTRVLVLCVLSFLFSTCSVAGAFAQGNPPLFTPGNLVVSVEGCGVNGGTCTAVPNGTGAGVGNSSVGGYGDNQASLFTLFQYAPSGTSNATFVNSLVLPQTGSGANLPVSAEYGSSSEGSVQLDLTGRYLTIMGYGVSANAFNANPTSFGVPGGELAQSGSLTGQSYTPIPRVVTTIDAYGNINSSTASYNVFNGNNPRSTFSADGFNFYISGQGADGDNTGGVFLTTLGTVNDAPTTITGNDAGGDESQDTRIVQIYNDTLYVSMDSKTGAYNRSYVGTLGTPPATSVYSCGSACPTDDGTIGPALLPGLGNTGGTGRAKLTRAQTNGLPTSTSGTYINLSPEGYFFASPTVLYVADSGSPKNTSADNETTYSLCGAGGLQKWVNESGTWTWVYTLYEGLNLVQNANSKSGDITCSTNTSGTTGLLGLTGVVSGSKVYLYATNYTIADLDPTYLYGITDVLGATTNPGNESFTQLAAAPSDSNFKGVTFAPSLPAGSSTITSSPSGLAVTTSGTGCTPGTYTTPVTLIWTPNSACTLSVASPQTASGTQYALSQWQDGTTATTDSVTAPTTSAVYTATFKAIPVVTWPTASAITYGQSLASSTLSGGSASVGGTFAFTTPSTIPGAGTAAQSVTFTPSNPADYATVTGTVNVTVNPATLTVTANPASMTAGASVPALTYTITGFVNGDTSSVVSGSATETTTATSSSPAGNYPITFSTEALTAANYTFVYVNGTLSVVTAPAVSITTTSAVTGTHAGGYVLTITVKNNGSAAVTNVVLSTAMLGSTSGTPLPQTISSIASGASGTFTVSVAGSVGIDGAGVSEKYSGTVTGGSFSASVRSVTLP